ncbi:MULTISPECIES: hypothetical protein [unclassified Oceanobacter]|uniref:hypothetical protein n=1 Tax=unclassified Oceanobacter TaxID=2620260 RepID=UPI0027343B6E|nr:MULTISPECIES: hypothetical protein [unclassified Oceanobacter]MDP2506677.1 hypothetical protein [Oceanobacter sp. 3_MG-2023]MDP2609281.1 hypothetical protein [Oceanobacter sp. 1_MG-2023]MDP2612622.1 hypothetical protein [Oceanobacter sp. 2_MG-2023]
MSQASPKRQQGFVITMELLLITTILILGSLVGLVAIRDALFKHKVQQQNMTPKVLDQQGRLLGEPVAYDEHEAPLLAYIDRSTDPLGRVLIGIRDDRFSSREAVYFDSASCQGDPCIKSVSDELTDSQGASRLNRSGNVSYLNALQGGANYAVGPGSDGLPGFLYRESPEQCDFDLDDVQSRWHSQSVVTGLPCEELTVEDMSVPAYTGCLLNVTPLLTDPLDPTSLDLNCSCPAGTTDQFNLIDQVAPLVGDLYDQTFATLGVLIAPPFDSDGLGTICCETPSELNESGLVETLAYLVLKDQLSQLALSALEQAELESLLESLLSPAELTCKPTLPLRAAESVASADDPAMNALEPFEPPFRVTLPAAASDVWISTPPDGVEGRP